MKLLFNGEELLLALETSVDLPTLILLDLNMPFMGGFEALRLIRQQPRYDAVPVVILTTSDQAADRQEAIALKADGFITKPATVEGLNQVVLHLRQAWLKGKCVGVQRCKR
ncbi:response regulator [Spirosoma pulveris]